MICPKIKFWEEDCHDIAFLKSWAKFGSNCQFSPKGNILVNLNVAFTYSLHPIMLVNISQISIEWIMKYEVAQIWGNFIKLSICPIKSFLGKNDCFLLLTFRVLSCLLTFQKEYLSRQWYWRLKKYGQIQF